MNRKPDFIGIGAPRTGTTWLFEVLKSHPDIQIPSKKAINFFNEYFDKGTEWYFNHFGNYSEKSVGEISPLYFGHSNLAERLYSVVPDAKLILIVRDPVERLKSHVTLINTLRGQEKTISDRVKELPLLLEHGLYFKHIKEILEYFPREHLLILPFSEIAQNPDRIYNEVLHFLCLSTDFRPSKLNEKVGYNITPKSRALESLRKSVHQFLIKNGMDNVVWFIKKRGLSSVIRKLNASKAQDTSGLLSSSESTDDLYDYYREDVESMSREFGLNLFSGSKTENI